MDFRVGSYPPMQRSSLCGDMHVSVHTAHGHIRASVLAPRACVQHVALLHGNQEYEGWLIEKSRFWGGRPGGGKHVQNGLFTHFEVPDGRAACAGADYVVC